MSDVVNNSNIDCLQGNTTYITLTFGSGDICRIALKAVNITLIYVCIYSVSKKKRKPRFNFKSLKNENKDHKTNNRE